MRFTGLDWAHLQEYHALVERLAHEAKKEQLLEPRLAVGSPVKTAHGRGLARPMQPEWVASIRAQCEAQGVPFFFKQWGGRRDKGGCLIYGGEIKQWPRAA